MNKVKKAFNSKWSINNNSDGFKIWNQNFKYPSSLSMIKNVKIPRWVIKYYKATYDHFQLQFAILIILEEAQVTPNLISSIIFFILWFL